ncbi:MAG: DNA polymerase III subunit delta [Lachnospiraceae bacterium]|nr:DNA polymerase III subunit delta [Lachnospiraceae bacterium]
MLTLNKDLKENNLKQIYLIYGQEDYLVSMYKSRLIKAMVRPDDDMNFTYFKSGELSVPALIDIAETMPFFASERLIVVEDSGLFKSGGDELNDYLEVLPETCRILFVEKQVDKRSKLYKTVAKKGYAAEMKQQDTDMLKNWILSIMKKEGFRITRGAMDLLLLYTGAEMNTIDKEIEKLICYRLEEKEIHTQDVEAITVRRVEDRIFDMIEAVAMQDQETALKLYYDLLSLKVAPGRIMYLLDRQFNLMYQTKILLEKGYDKSSIADKTGLKPFIAGKYITQSGHFSTARLKSFLDEGCSMEEDIKTGRIADRLAVELMLVKWSTKKR